MHFLPSMIVYVMGSAGNYLTSFEEWPERQQTSLYLGPNGTLDTTAPAAADISYVYDPSNPAPSYGGWIFQATNPLGEAAVDQSPLSNRSDVLQFNGEPLADDLAICGAISASLTVASSANDTDFIVRLVDQYPTGERFQIAEGIIRMRWRGNVHKPVPMEPNASYPVEIDMWSACWVIRAGHRVGMDVTSSSSFMYLPNPNTGLPLEKDGVWPQGGEIYKGQNITATNAVLLGTSRVLLPVVSQSDLPRMAPLPIPAPNITMPSEAKLEEMGREWLTTSKSA